MPRPPSRPLQKAEPTDAAHYEDIDVSTDLDHSAAMRQHDVRSETTGTPQSTPPEDHTATSSSHQPALDKATKEFVLSW